MAKRAPGGIDGEVRALERRARMTGETADEATLLHARLRAGDLSEDRLRLAATCAHTAARAALGERGRAPRLTASRISGFGKEAVVRAGLALLESRLVEVVRAQQRTPRRRPSPLALGEVDAVRPEVSLLRALENAPVLALRAIGGDPVQAEALLLGAIRREVVPRLLEASEEEISMRRLFARVSRRVRLVLPVR